MTPDPDRQTSALPRGSLSTSSGQAVILSWLISVAWHAVVFAAMFLTAWLTDLAAEQADLPLAQTDLLGDISDTRMQISTDSDMLAQTETPTSSVPKLEPKKFDMLSRSPAGARPDLDIIGIGTGGGDDLARYGLRASAGGPGPDFFGIGRRARGARRIVYVVDRSGSMLTTIHAVKVELRKSVDALRRSQRFHVIFFNAGPPLENKPHKLVPATGRQKAELFEFIDGIMAEGNTDPIPAMERAFAVKPDLIYFLTDGDFDPLLLEVLRKWNSDKAVKIFTIAYVSQAGRILLEQIAREHEGEFRFVSELDIY